MSERAGKLIIPIYVVLMLAVCIIAISCGVKKYNERKAATEPESEVVETVETETETEIEETEFETEIVEDEEPTEESEESGYTTVYAVEMFTVTNLNIRKGPGTEFEILTTVPVNTMLCVLGTLDGGWSQIEYEDGTYYVCSDYLSYDRINLAEPYEMVNYGIWTGQYWHFTPEEIDNRWNGMKSNKPILPTGTTRLWQKYLYEKLAERNCEWFYKYALAQAFQESSWNPYATSADGLDMGLFQFRRMYWNEAYGDIYDYKANINAYVDRVWKLLMSVESDNDLYAVIDQHKNPIGGLDMDYVNRVLSAMNYLWEQ